MLANKHYTFSIMIVTKFYLMSSLCNNKKTYCGLFAAAFATAICYGHDPTLLNFDQDSMRQHFKQCITSKKAEMFPYSQKRSSSRRQDALIVPYERIQDYKPPTHSLKSI